MDFSASNPKSNAYISLLMLLVSVIFLLFIYSALINSTKLFRQSFKMELGY